MLPDFSLSPAPKDYDLSKIKLIHILQLKYVLYRNIYNDRIRIVTKHIHIMRQNVEYE